MSSELRVVGRDRFVTEYDTGSQRCRASDITTFSDKGTLNPRIGINGISRPDDAVDNLRTFIDFESRGLDLSQSGSYPLEQTFPLQAELIGISTRFGTPAEMPASIAGAMSAGRSTRRAATPMEAASA